MSKSIYKMSDEELREEWRRRLREAKECAGDEPSTYSLIRHASVYLTGAMAIGSLEPPDVHNPLYDCLSLAEDWEEFYQLIDRPDLVYDFWKDYKAVESEEV